MGRNRDKVLNFSSFSKDKIEKKKCFLRKQMLKTHSILAITFIIINNKTLFNLILKVQLLKLYF